MIRMIYLIVGLLIFAAQKLQASTLRHQILSSDSATSLQTQGLCHSFYETATSVFCMPWTNEPNEKGSIGLFAVLKADEQGIKITERVNRKDINQNFIATLFRDENFHDASGYVQARAVYHNFGLNLVPLQVSGAYKVNNPGLPEVHLAGVQKSLISLSYIWMPSPPLRSLSWIVAPVVYQSKTIIRYADFMILDTATQSLDSLINSTEDSRTDLDLAMGVLSSLWYFPSITLRGFHLLTEERCIVCKTMFFEVEKSLLRNSSAALSWSIRHPIGYSIFGVLMPFDDIFKVSKQEVSAFSYTYRLSRLQSFVSLSQVKSSFGFILSTGNYQMGIQYTNETQPKALSKKNLKQAYVYAGLDL